MSSSGRFFAKPVSNTHSPAQTYLYFELDLDPCFAVDFVPFVSLFLVPALRDFSFSFFMTVLS